MFSRMSSSSTVRDRRIGVPFAAESIKSQSQLNRESVGDRAMMATIIPKKVFERYEKDARLKSFRRTMTSPTISAPLDSGLSIDSSSHGSPKTPKETESPPSRGRKSDISGPSPSKSPDRGSRSHRSDTATSLNTSANSSGQSGKMNAVPVRDDHIHAGLFAFHEDSKILFSCGHWDHSFKVTAVETGRILQSVSHHRDVITCLSLATEYHSTWLVSGSRDCTVMVWEVHPDRENNPVTAVPLFTLFGHDDAVTSICVCPKLNVVISGSEDGTVIMHSLRDGVYIRSIVVGSLESAMPAASINLTEGGEGSADAGSAVQQEAIATQNAGRRRISWIGITSDGVVVIYMLDDHLLCSYTINGRHLASRTIKDYLHALTLSTDGKVLVTGGNNGLIVLRWVSPAVILYCISSHYFDNLYVIFLQVHTLQLANTGARKDLEAVFDGSSEETTNVYAPFSYPIRSLCLTRHERHLIVGLENGEIRVLAQNSDYLRQRLQKKLIEIGIL